MPCTDCSGDLGWFVHAACILSCLISDCWAWLYTFTDSIKKWAGPRGRSVTSNKASKTLKRRRERAEVRLHKVQNKTRIKKKHYSKRKWSNLNVKSTRSRLFPLKRIVESKIDGKIKYYSLINARAIEGIHHCLFLPTTTVTINTNLIKLQKIILISCHLLVYSQTHCHFSSIQA